MVAAPCLRLAAPGIEACANLHGVGPVEAAPCHRFVAAGIQAEAIPHGAGGADAVSTVVAPTTARSGHGRASHRFATLGIKADAIPHGVGPVEAAPRHCFAALGTGEVLVRAARAQSRKSRQRREAHSRQRVFIMDECEDLMPGLNYVKDVVTLRIVL
jgi:hypothetical protein